MHWFCPRAGPNDYGSFFAEDVYSSLANESEAGKAVRLERIREAEARRDLALECCTILAFDGPAALGYQDNFKAGLRTQMTRCDVCVREYHRARNIMMQRLAESYDEDQVDEFIAVFDKVNLERIGKGLNDARDSLLDLPPDKRSIFAVGDASMYAFFEAMNCIPFLQSEKLLQEHFDHPFRLVQANKKIKLPSYAPAMTCFIFSANPERTSWAKRNFGQVKRPLTSAEFEHGVKSFLEKALHRVVITSIEKEFLPQFWSGVRELVMKLTKELVQGNLRAMDVSLYEQGLQHFQIDGVHFQDLLLSFQHLLALSPYDFWEAIRPATAQNFVDEVFRSPTLDSLMKITTEREPLRLEEKVQWPGMVINSVPPGNLLLPLRATLHQLFGRFQQDEYSRYAQSVTWSQGLLCLRTALKIVKAKLRTGPVAASMLKLIATEYGENISQELSAIGRKTDSELSKSEELCLDIIEAGLSLDISGLTHDRDTIFRTKTLDHNLDLSSSDLWKMSTRQLRRSNHALATSILSGTTRVLGLENFTDRQKKDHQSKAGETWNNALQQVTDIVCNDVLERIELFDEEPFQNLLQETRAIRGLTFFLFSGDSRIHQSSLNIFKRFANANDRRDSLMYIVKGAFRSAMPSITQALDQLSRYRAFHPCAMAILICRDILDCFCNTQDGLLRSRTFQPAELQQLQGFWQKLWEFLGMIFAQTEAWSGLGHDKSMLEDFCRETMEFADYAFDQYAIFASILQSSSTQNRAEVRKMLLEQPRRKFLQIVSWLRLRGDDLIAAAVRLTVKILGRLREADVQVQTDAAQYIESMYAFAGGDKLARTRTKLDMQQKAELQRALENHLGSQREVIDVDAFEKPKKQSSLQGWALSGRSSGASTPTSETSKSSRPGTIDVDAWTDTAKRRKDLDATSYRESQKLTNPMPGTDSYKQRMLAQQQKRPSVGLATAKAAERQQKGQQDFLAKRAREKQEAERRRQAALAKAKVPGVGSGVTGVGDLGQEHDFRGQGVMVSDAESDSEEDDSDDDNDDDDEMGLFGPPKKKIERPNYQSGEQLGLPIEQKAGPTKIHRAQRSARDMRARLAPDLTPLHRAILKWDFFHTGDYPPGTDEQRYLGVAKSFHDLQLYQQTFQPLLTLEAWQGMVKAREEGTSKPYEVKVQNRTNVDSFVEISSIISHNENRELQLQESDIVLLSKAKKPTDDQTAPSCLARIYRIKRQKAHCEVLYQILPNTPLAPSLSGQAVVWAVKVQSITPLEREYGALQALQFYDLCTQIIRAKPSRRVEYSDKQVAAYQDVWNVNRAQGEAVHAALDNDGFSLIQGPPGSGKTKTIIAIVGGLLTKVLGSTKSGTKLDAPTMRGAPAVGGDAPSKKLLVCAPSNAAVDELVIRLKEGVKTRDGRHCALNVVRIGRSEAINTQVRDVTMEELVAKKLGTNENDQKLRQRNAELFKQHEKVSAQLRELNAQRDDGKLRDEELTNLENEIAAVRRAKNALGVKIDNAKDAERNAGRQAELSRKRAQQAVLDDAHVICATLSGSGHDMFQSLNIEFETVIIDEAAQCVEMSSLIPLKYGCVKCIMVGDPKQLPPTVFSKEAAKFQYEQSLFVRMQNNHEKDVHLLDTQYRMHPDISIFPSQTFYDGLLKDGQGMAALRKRPWHASAVLAPYRFFDVAGQHQAAPRGHSLVNVVEIDIAIALFERLRIDYPSYDYKSNIGIITPYKSQLRALKERFSSRYGTTILEEVEFNTTDAFQGREAEIIIFSCVRASPAGGIGFLQDIRRMNVGLTRAKCSLWVLGNSQSLVRGRYWQKLVEDARARDLYSTGDLRAMLAKPSSTCPAVGNNDRSMLDVSSHTWQMNGNRTRVDDSVSTEFKGASTSFEYPDESGKNLSMASLGSDRMEGVSYRFEDRHPKKNMAASDTGSGGDRPLPQSESPAEPQDVEMGDTGTPASGSATPIDRRSRAETPLSGAEQSVNQANGVVKPKAALPPKKRPAANPLMPRKQQRPRP